MPYVLNNGSSDLQCMDCFGLFVQKVEFQYTYTIQLDFPNIATDENGNAGQWTVVGNQVSETQDCLPSCLGIYKFLSVLT